MVNCSQLNQVLPWILTETLLQGLFPAALGWYCRRMGWFYLQMANWEKKINSSQDLKTHPVQLHSGKFQLQIWLLWWQRLKLFWWLVLVLYSIWIPPQPAQRELLTANQVFHLKDFAIYFWRITDYSSWTGRFAAPTKPAHQKIWHQQTCWLEIIL